MSSEKQGIRNDSPYLQSLYKNSSEPDKRAFSRETMIEIEKAKKELGSSVRRLTGEEREVLLKLHNDARAKVGQKPLQWSEKLADYAARYASQCQIQHWRESSYPYPKDMTKHGNIEKVMGENLAWSCPSYGFDGKSPAQRGVEQWLEELPDYDCQKNKCDPGDGKMCGHLTQMLWDKTEYIGCSIAKCPKSFGGHTCKRGGPGFEYLACEYYPTGNVVTASGPQRAIPNVETCKKLDSLVVSYGVLAPYYSQDIWE
jgi:pathogenesis-related protein 1